MSHYLIHLYDYPPIAEKGLRCRAPLCQDRAGGAHAQHMPSLHIFTRVGYWTESGIASNVEVARSRRRRETSMTSCTPWTTWVYAHSQLRTGRESQGYHRRDDDSHRFDGIVFTRALRTGRFAGTLRRGARRLEGRGGTRGPSQPLPHVQAITHFARAFGVARPTIPKPPRQTSPNLPSCGTNCATRRTPIGRSRWTLSGRSRLRGFSMPRASPTRR